MRHPMGTRPLPSQRRAVSRRHPILPPHPAGGVASLLAEHAGPDAEVAVSLHLHLLVALLLEVDEQICGGEVTQSITARA